MPVPAIDLRWVARGLAIAVGALAACTLAAYALELGLDLPDASAVYLLGVAAVAITYGAAAAVATAIGAFLIYNYLFVDPRYTFTVASPPEFLNLILLLAIGILIARLAGQQRDRARQAARREREARALFAVGRSLNAAESLSAALSDVVQRVAADAGMERVWIGASTGGARERRFADTLPLEAALPETRSHWVLRRDPGEGEATWLRVLPPAARQTGPSDQSRNLVRRAWRAAEGLQAPLTAVWVDTPAWGKASPEDKARLEENLRFAEDIGAEVARLREGDAATAILQLARDRNVESIFVGRPSTPPWRRLVAGQPLADQLIERGRDERVGIHVLTSR